MNPARKYNISILDKISFSSEQYCKRNEQQLQELTDKKDRIEKLIANILNNGEGYSKLKQIVKENVKAVLSDNKILISLSFTALIQTLKTYPELVNLIYSTSTANKGKQHKDNNDNITKYLEFNKDSLLDLTEKYYENLLEALANNAIDAVGASSSPNPSLSLPSSSITFPNTSDQSDNYRRKEPF